MPARADRRRRFDRRTAEHRAARDRRRGRGRRGAAAEDGSWTNSPTSFTYQWQRCDLDAILRQRSPVRPGKTYGVRNADVGFRLRVEVTAKNANGCGTAISAPSAIVVPVGPDHEAGRASR